MKIEHCNQKEKMIEVGDIVSYKGETCIVIFQEETFVEDIEEKIELQFPFGLINLNTGELENAFPYLEGLNNHHDTKLLCKNDKAKLTIPYKEGE